MANNTFDVGLKDICDRLKIWRPSVDEEDEGEFHPLMAARDETFGGKK